MGAQEIDATASYLVTGGGGFIGSHLVEALVARGNRVRVLDDLSTGKVENIPAGCEFIHGDVTDADTVRRAMAGVAGCWHLAAIASNNRSIAEWVTTHRVNQTGTIQIFEAARHGGGRGAPIPVVYASSAAVFGDTAQMPLTETSATKPLTAYGADKLGTELHGRVGALVHGIPNVGLRFFNVYGVRQDPHSSYSGVVSLFLERVRCSEPLIIYGDGDQTRDFVHVSDVVRFLLAVMGRGQPQPELYNVCTGRQTTITQLAHTLFQVCGRTVPITYRPPRSGDIRLSVGDPGKAAQTLGLTATTTLRQGLEQIVRLL